MKQPLGFVLAVVAFAMAIGSFAMPPPWGMWAAGVSLGMAIVICSVVPARYWHGRRGTPRKCLK